MEQQEWEQGCDPRHGRRHTATNKDKPFSATSLSASKRATYSPSFCSHAFCRASVRFQLLLGNN